jgi:hypothetical protein
VIAAWSVVHELASKAAPGAQLGVDTLPCSPFSMMMYYLLGELAPPIYQGGPICVSREKPRFGFIY